jgi:hypothetical protein
MSLRFALAVVSLAPVALMGCYTYTYTPVTPAPGSQLSLALNDMGRANLVDHIGPEVASVEGELVSAADSQYVLRVNRTIGFRGQESRWSGEQVSVRYGYVGMVRERSFSPQKTAVAVGALTAGVVAFVATRNLLGSSSGGNTGQPPPPNNGQ